MKKLLMAMLVAVAVAGCTTTDAGGSCDKCCKSGACSAEKSCPVSK